MLVNNAPLHLRSVSTIRSTNKFPPFAKDGATNKLQLKLFDVKRHIVRLDIRQHHNLEILAILYQHHTFFCTKMPSFEPNKRHLRELLIYFFNLKKSAAKVHRLLVEAYGDAALNERSCREWFQKFKNGEFDVEECSGRSKVYEDAELEALLDEDSCQTQKKLALTLGVTQQTISYRLKSLGMIQKQGNWVPYELKPRNVERPFFTCEMLLARRNERVFCIV